jgi:hypothetical protein
MSGRRHWFFKRAPVRGLLNRNSERIPRSLLRGMRANIKIGSKVLTVEDSLQLAAGIFN